ncbi:MIZ/SP-RING zinc finger domain-containing protein [Ditylenchus destructor]|nr:MIZ/SP-RING zinc finger domain-containing protein [Ditylenchus destructor]
MAESSSRYSLRDTMKTPQEVLLTQWEVEYSKLISNEKRRIPLESVKTAIRSAFKDGMFEHWRITLKCPLSRQRIRVPVRFADCTHVECFDLETFLQMKMQKNFLVCPICQKQVEKPMANLRIDKYIEEVLSTLPDALQIDLQSDGSFTEVHEKFVVAPNVIDDEILYVQDNNAPALEVKQDQQNFVVPSKSFLCNKRSHLDNASENSVGTPKKRIVPSNEEPIAELAADVSVHFGQSSSEEALSSTYDHIGRQNGASIAATNEKDCDNELEASMSMAIKLRTKLDIREAEVQQYREKLEKAEQENIRLKNESRDLQLKSGGVQYFTTLINSAKADFDSANELEALMSKADAATAMVERLQIKLHKREAELQQYREILQKSQEENNRLKNEIRDLQQDLDDYEKIVAQNTNDNMKLRKDLNGTIAEKDRLNADLTTANESMETSKKRTSIHICYLKRQLKQNLAQSQNLNAELENTKKENEVLRSTNKELEKEARRLWNQIYGSSSDGQGSSKNESENDTSGLTQNLDPFRNQSTSMNVILDAPNDLAQKMKIINAAMRKTKYEERCKQNRLKAKADKLRKEKEEIRNRLRNKNHKKRCEEENKAHP